MNIIEKYIKNIKFKIIIYIIVGILFFSSLTLQILNFRMYKNQIYGLLLAILSIVIIDIIISFVIYLTWKKWSLNHEGLFTDDEVESFNKKSIHAFKKTIFNHGYYFFVITFVFLLSLYFMIAEYDKSILISINNFYLKYHFLISSNIFYIFLIFTLGSISIWSTNPKKKMLDKIKFISGVIFAIYLLDVNSNQILMAFVSKSGFAFVILILEFVLLSILGFFNKFKKEKMIF